MKKMTDYAKNLSQFTGTENYHRIQPLASRVLGTDGVAYVAEEMKAHWLVSDIMIAIAVKFRRIPFQVWELKVNDDRTAVLTMREDKGQKPKYRQKYDYTSFPMKEIKFYAVDGSLNPEGPVYKILMLPGEY
jgi:hypothetical protein